MMSARALVWFQQTLPFFGRSIDNIIPGKLWLGDLSGAYNYEWLKQQGITHIVSVLNFPRDQVQIYPEDFQYLYINKADNTQTNLLDVWPQTNAFIDAAIQQGGKVYVHCKFGRSRSVATVAAYLICKYNMNVSQVLIYIRNRREQASPNQFFVFQLYIWARDYKDECNTSDEFV